MYVDHGVSTGSVNYHIRRPGSRNTRLRQGDDNRWRIEQACTNKSPLPGYRKVCIVNWLVDFGRIFAVMLGSIGQNRTVVPVSN